MYSSVIAEDTVMSKRALCDGVVVTVAEKDAPKIRPLCALSKVVVINEQNIVVEQRVPAMKNMEGNETVKMMVNFHCLFWPCFHCTKNKSKSTA